MRLADTLFRVPRTPGVHVIQQRGGDGARELSSWREAFVSNALRGVRPVRAIDGHRLKVPTAESSPTRTLQRALERQMGLA